ncbi:3-phenylpropionate/cinnamic acid dioxygenase subunit beta [Brevibacillus fulvus]|uniref:3-phenylpropionate/cinnamic acid dioxygenase small subunit n=1 Tax=Brevibacillus fulvus TaxID=1125967 RepID=A0A938XWG6_9BACL|nr:3-phenylpropionate/cinnamic acid dioxygenase small subunit [Brevibacillus fulvus]
MIAEVHFEITQFLHREAFLLDSRRFAEWLDLLADDIVYRMPLRATRENRDGSGIVEAMTFFEETKTSLTTRVNRLGTTSAWAEDPAPRTRHFVSNLIVEQMPDQQLVKARSNFLLKRSRAADLSAEELFGERMDVLRKEKDGWKLVTRTIYPDQTVISMMNLSMFL